LEHVGGLSQLVRFLHDLFLFALSALKCSYCLFLCLVLVHQLQHLVVIVVHGPRRLKRLIPPHSVLESVMLKACSLDTVALLLSRELLEPLLLLLQLLRFLFVLLYCS